MSNADLTTLTTPRRTDAHRFSLDVPDGWQQGRGAFGGFVIASLARAIETVVDDRSRTIRSLTATLCGPVAVGAADILVETLRIGSGTSALAARVVQDGEVQAHAVIVLGRTRNVTAQWSELGSPDAMPPWRDVPALPPLDGLAPTFSQHFEFRNVGPIPYTQSPTARAAGWIRPKAPGAARDAAYLAACIDAWWPASLARFAEPHPIATISFAFECVDPLAGLDPEAPFFHEGHAVTVRDGFSVERRSLRGEDGRVVALNEQTIVLIR